jgi:hypothetical protein
MLARGRAARLLAQLPPLRLVGATVHRQAAPPRLPFPVQAYSRVTCPLPMGLASYACQDI